jgi:hypothetical protein
MKKTGFIISFLIALGGIYGMYWMLSPNHSEWDNIEKENPKMVEMFNSELDRIIQDHTKSSFNPGYNEISHLSTQAYFKTLKSIESYARHGVMSTKARNSLYLKLNFNDGKEVKEVYTGHSVSCYMGPSLLMKVYFENGRIQRVFTNGVEKEGSPEWVKNDMYTLLKAALNQDIHENWDQYFPPKKTKSDFDKEWDEL